MELTRYDLILGTHFSTKSMLLRKNQGKITFKVHRDATKTMVRDAVEKIWNVKVEKVQTITVPGKTRTFNRKRVVLPTTKKAVITLKQGYKIDLGDQFESFGQVPAEQVVESKAGE